MEVAAIVATPEAGPLRAIVEHGNPLRRPLRVHLDRLARQDPARAASLVDSLKLPIQLGIAGFPLALQPQRQLGIRELDAEAVFRELILSAGFALIFAGMSGLREIDCSSRYSQPG